MKKKQIFPIEIIENSSEKLISSHQIKTHIIYNIVVIAVLLAFVLSFFIKVDVNIVSQGIAKTPGERVIISSPYGAFINDIYVEENSKIKQGDTILILNAEQIENEQQKYTNRLKEVSEYINDLQILIKYDRNSNNLDPSQLQSSTYKRSLNYYIYQCIDLETKARNIAENYNRNKKLLEYGDIPKSEFEPIKAEYDNSIIAIDLLLKRQHNEWQAELDRFINEQRDLNAQIKQLKLKNKESKVISPITGIIQRIEGISKGSYVQQGQKLFEISLDKQLYAECLIPPKDIGYIRIGQKVKMQVDAFNYNEWGFISGKVGEIFNDITLVNSSKGTIPYYKVICSIDNPYLTLKNGYVGELKRGMTMNCRFLVTRRTLFQLLYDKVDDWLNPNINNS